LESDRLPFNDVPDVRAHAAVSLSERVEVLEVDDVLVVVDEKNGRAYALDAIASCVWEGLSAGLTVSAIVDELAPMFSAPFEVIAGDVDKLARDLIELGVFTAAGLDHTRGINLDECVSDTEQASAVAGSHSSETTGFDDQYVAAPSNT
jgi:hypothetical protein